MSLEQFLEKFHLRKNLYLIGQNMGKADVNNLKFLCDYDLPKRHLEKIETAFELFCALEESDLIGITNQTKLVELLQSMGKGHLLNKHPLHNIEDRTETDRGGRLPTDKEKQEMVKFLLKISNDMSHRDLRNLICFVYDMIHDDQTLIDMDSIKDGTSVFKGLIKARLIGPNNMKLLEEVFELIGRNDLCQKIRERPAFTSAPTPSSGELPSSQNNVPYVSSNYSTTSSFISSSSSSGDDSSMPSGNPLHGQDMSLDHGGNGSSAVTPTRSTQVVVQTPHQSASGDSIRGEAHIFHGSAAHHHTVHPPSPSAPVMNSTSLPVSNHGNHSNHGGTPSSSVLSGSSVSPYQTIPQPETYGNPLPIQHDLPTSPHSTPAYQQCHQPEVISGGGSLQHHHVVPTMYPSNLQRIATGGEGGHHHPVAPVLVAQSEQDLIAQLEDKERQLKESDHVRSELLAMLEFQRGLMTQLMSQTSSDNSHVASSPPPPQPNQYPMTCSPHGLAVIIGNDQFIPNPRRPKLDLGGRRGSDLDMINYDNIFSVLGYEVHQYHNQTSAQINDIFKTISTTDHTSYDSFVMCITTHGESNSFVFGSDSVSLDLYKLIKGIQTCPSLINKPKLFFVQACRMPSEDLVSPDSGGTGTKLNLARNFEADVFIAWATSRDQAAYRSQQEGSWFVSALRYVFGKYASTRDLVSMMYEVTKLVTAAEGIESGSNEPVQQCVETSSQLRGPVRFIF